FLSYFLRFSNFLFFFFIFIFCNVSWQPQLGCYAKAIVQARKVVECLPVYSMPKPKVNPYKLRDIVKKFSADGIQSDGSVISIQKWGTWLKAAKFI
ncbi:hypothetical protein L9F63_022524, partial [Diploptera punctata]